MESQHVDVLIIGAGISGIGAACRLRLACPDRTFAILEARDAIGGTWDTFRFPGIRSDTDMHTLGYPFHPWREERLIADGASIRSYVEATADEFGVREAIRFGHRVVAATWSTEDARWTVEAERVETGETVTVTCGFLYSCTGYYRHDRGHAPAFPGAERFRGETVHPQSWPADLSLDGKRVVIIGSGATAVTTAPAIAQTASHVTILQRSPSYVISLPSSNPALGFLTRVLPDRIGYPLARWLLAAVAIGIYSFSRRFPEAAKKLIRAGMKRQLPQGYDVDTHFRPRYQPWDERMCIVPDNDLFEAISAGRVDMVTDHIETFDETGIRLTSGGHLDADVIVTATGLSIVPFGDVHLRIDGSDVELPRVLTHRGMMLAGVPNFAFAFGYINQSWTLGADLTSERVCALLNHMRRAGYAVVTPRPAAGVEGSLPMLAGLNSGYVRRGVDAFPRQAVEEPWLRPQNWLRNKAALRRAHFDTDGLEFRRAPASEPAAPVAA